MYFDTLKVSNVEQTADSVSARGGLGNAEQVIWDFNKELSISIQDALYTPASQSLLWGGLYSLKPLKLKGIWVKANYSLDEYGNPIYYRKEIVDTPIDNSYVKFVCPCDNQVKWAKYTSLSIEPRPIQGTPLTYNNQEIQFMNFQNGRTIDIYNYDDIKSQGIDAEITIDNFSDFGIDIYDYTKTGGAQGNQFQVSYKCTNPTPAQMTQTQQNIIEYRWTTCLATLLTNEFDAEQVITDKITVYIQSFNDNDNKRVLFQNTYKNSDNKYSYLHFYTDIVKTLDGYDSNNKPIKKSYPMRIYLGTFYLVEDWVMENGTAYSGLNYIDMGADSIKQLNTVKEEIACRKFAIDINRNIQAYNVLKSPKYIKNNIECYLDPNTLYPYTANDHEFTKANGETIKGDFKVFQPEEVYLKYKRVYKEDNSIGKEITINAKNFPTLFKFVGETKIRDRDGIDHCYQIEIPKCKLLSNINLNLQAGGEPTTIDINFKALQDITGVIAKIKLYEVEVEKPKEIEVYHESTSDGPKYRLPRPEIPKHDILIEEKKHRDLHRSTSDGPKYRLPRPTLPVLIGEEVTYTLRIVRPTMDEIYCVGKDCRIKTYGNNSYTYLRLPNSQEEASVAARNWEEHREILLVQIYNQGQFVRYLTSNDSQVITITK